MFAARRTHIPRPRNEILTAVETNLYSLSATYYKAGNEDVITEGI